MRKYYSLLRFCLVGVVNTGTYYGLYLLFLHWFGLVYLLSHISAFVLSMIGSYFMNTYFTYRTKPSWKKFFQFPLTYLVNITVTTAGVYIFVDLLQMDENISPLLASILAIPFTYMVSKKILIDRADSTI
jgi:putative flippase GtrA